LIIWQWLTFLGHPVQPVLVITKHCFLWFSSVKFENYNARFILAIRAWTRWPLVDTHSSDLYAVFCCACNFCYFGILL